MDLLEVDEGRRRNHSLAPCTAASRSAWCRYEPVAESNNNLRVIDYQRYSTLMTRTGVPVGPSSSNNYSPVANAVHQLRSIEQID